jgi:sigma-B regulation protein RsbU (phosphoserine phosphatase)
MLPRRFPRRREFELMAEVSPARSVGGDLYDFLLDGDRLWFLVGDVSGKGVAAALFMAVAKTLFHASIPGESSPSGVFSRVNRELCRDNDDAMFVTAFAGCLDLRTGEVVTGNAGHPAPYRLGGNGAVTSVSAAPGLPLGVRGDYEYTGGGVILGPGEALYLYTDGVTEAVNEQGEQFSAARLEAYLRGASGVPAADIVRGSLAAVQDFAGGTPPFDDITVMTLRYLAG